jgi:hypothetical protein
VVARGRCTIQGANIMKRYGRAVALAVAMVMLVGACTSDPDKATVGGSGGGGSTKGRTDDTIKIGFIGADFGPLAEAGLAPDLGDQPTIVNAVVDAINNSGGVGGRKIEVRIKGYVTFLSSTTPLDAGRVLVRWIFTAPKANGEGAAEAAADSFCAGVSQDIPIWENKVYRERPLLSEADGPIPLYRRWARQFYADADPLRAAG